MGVIVETPLLTKSVNALVMYQGQSKSIKIVATEPGVDVNGNPVNTPLDLTGAVIVFQLRKDISDQDYLIQKISTDSTQIQIMTPAKNGIAVMFMKPNDTKYLDTGSYLYDIWVQDQVGNEFPIVEVSEFIIKQPVTRRVF